MDAFESLDKESTDYCMKEFPILVQTALNKKVHDINYDNCNNGPKNNPILVKKNI